MVSVPGDYVCRKCVQQQLLAAHIERLELWLDSYWSIHDAEKLVNSTYSELVAPQVKRTEREQVAISQPNSRQVVQESPAVISLLNRYTILDTVRGDGSSGEGSSSQVHGTIGGSAAQEGRKKSGRAIVIGDSIVRGKDRRFCGRKRDSRMVCRLPGTRIRDVTEWLQNILEGEGEQPAVVVHIGTNEYR